MPGESSGTTGLSSPNAPPVDRGVIDGLTVKPPAPEHVWVNGKAYTAKEISEMQGQLSTATQKAAEHEAALSSLRDDIKALYSDGTDRAAVETAFRRQLTAAGFAPEAIEAEVSRTLAPKDTGKGEGTDKGKPDEPAAPNALQRELDAIKDVLKTQVASGVSTIVDGALSNDLKAFIDGASRDARAAESDPSTSEAQARIAERVKAVTEFLRSEVRTALNESLKRKVAETGRLDFGWLSEIAPSAVKSVVGKARTLIGDPQRMGRSSQASGEDPFRVIAQKPVDPPKYAPGKTTHDVFSETDQWITDRLSRLAAKNMAGNVA